MDVDTRLPLAVKGFNFDPVNAFAAAQRVKGTILNNEGQALQNRGSEMQNAMGAMQFEEATGQHNAMKSYREAAAAGDENALDTLDGYPEIQLKVTQALDGLDEADRMKAVQRGKDVADAARRVVDIPEGPAKLEAWQREVDKLLADGDVSQEWADANRGTVSQESLDQALRMGETIEQYIARKDAEAQKKLADAQAHPKTEADLTLSQRLEIEKAARERVDAAVGNSAIPLDPDVAQQMFTDAKSDILKGLGITPSTPTITPPPAEGEGADLGEPADGAEKATPPAAWTDLSPEAQTAAAEMLTSRLSDPSIDRAAEIADFDAHFGEGAAAAVLKAHGD